MADKGQQRIKRLAFGFGQKLHSPENRPAAAVFDFTADYFFQIFHNV